MKLSIDLRQDGDMIEGTLYGPGQAFLGHSRQANRQDVLRSLTTFGLTLLKQANKAGTVVLRKDIPAEVAK